VAEVWFSFAKEPYKRDAVLQKRLIILSILLTVATPYRVLVAEVWFSFSDIQGSFAEI